MPPEVSLGLGPPALLAMMIWSTLRMVAAAFVEYLRAHCLARSRSKTLDSRQS